MFSPETWQGVAKRKLSSQAKSKATSKSPSRPFTLVPRGSILKVKKKSAYVKMSVIMKHKENNLLNSYLKTYN